MLASCSSSTPFSHLAVQGQSRGLRCCPWLQWRVNPFSFSSLSSFTEKAYQYHVTRVDRQHPGHCAASLVASGLLPADGEDRNVTSTILFTTAKLTLNKLKLSTSLFHSKENVGTTTSTTTNELQTKYKQTNNIDLHAVSYTHLTLPTSVAV